ncbi:MAG: hypothetical protein IH840_14955 [Candidatus Heimdallarchaeota archaeon]|nr:hypothetical protein [Candidatus Heimdallarchaeota archaeon]
MTWIVATLGPSGGAHQHPGYDGHGAAQEPGPGRLHQVCERLPGFPRHRELRTGGKGPERRQLPALATGKITWASPPPAPPQHSHGRPLPPQENQPLSR